MDSATELTVLLEEWSRGEPGALDRLTPLVYPDVHAIAKGYLRRGARTGMLQTTALVNELFLKLLAHAPQKLESRRHFFALCARMIRHALVDDCRQNLAAKRGGALQRVPLHEDLAWVDAGGEDMIAFDQALAELERMDAQQADLFSMRMVLGCTAEETAALTGLSKATVDRKVRLARVWLFQRLNKDGEADPDAAPYSSLER